MAKVEIQIVVHSKLAEMAAKAALVVLWLPIRLGFIHPDGETVRRVAEMCATLCWAEAREVDREGG